MKKLLCLLLSAYAGVSFGGKYTTLEMAMIDSDVFDCISDFMKSTRSCKQFDWYLGKGIEGKVITTSMDSFSYEVEKFGKKEGKHFG